MEWMRKHLLIVLGVTFLLGVGFGASGDDISTVADAPEEGERRVPTFSDDEPETEPEPEPEPEFDKPTKDDFKLKLKKIDEQCFGSAGCHTEVRVIIGIANDIELDPTKTYELRYRIVGADDPLLATTEITGRNYTVNEHSFGTAIGADLEAIVLSVSAF